MIKFLILLVLIFILILYISQKENYTKYDTLYQAYEVPYTGDTFIAAGDRPALGHYLRLDNTPPFMSEYEDKQLKQDPCNICMIKCLNPTSLIYKKKSDALDKCLGYCTEECKGKDADKIIQDAIIESKDQLKHDTFGDGRNFEGANTSFNVFENYNSAPQNYYIQGGWQTLPEWMER